MKVHYAFCHDCGWETIDNRLVYCIKCHGVLVAHFGNPKKLKLNKQEIEEQNKKTIDNFKREIRKHGTQYLYPHLFTKSEGKN